MSCQKELDPYTPPTDSDSTSVPVDTTGADTSAATGAYHPLTVGSFWNYKDSATGTKTTNSIGDSTKTINGILFRQYNSTGTASGLSGYIASPSPNYYLVAQGADPNAGTSLNLTFYYLNDTASVGSSWDYTAGGGTGFTAYTTTTVVAKGITMTVEGKTYTDVIQTHLDLSYNIFGSLTNYGGYDYFVAKNIGFIKIRSALVGLPKTCLNLIDYDIK